MTSQQHVLKSYYYPQKVYDEIVLLEQCEPSSSILMQLEEGTTNIECVHYSTAFMREFVKSFPRVLMMDSTFDSDDQVDNHSCTTTTVLPYFILIA